MTRTALDLAPKEWRSYRISEVLKRREKEDDKGVELRKREAWSIAREAAEFLRREFGAKRVVVFGSLVHEKRFTIWSDIDIAAWGIPPEEYYSSVAAVTGLSPVFKVDLIDVEECRPILREVIEQEGIEV